MKHKWYDVIVAWAEGKKIQYVSVGPNKPKWTDWEYGTKLTPAFYSDSLIWRIKPETVIRRYRMALVKVQSVDKEVCIAVDVTDSSLDDPVEYNVKGFIKWVGETQMVETEFPSTAASKIIS